jgi:hypothetical protein
MNLKAIVCVIAAALLSGCATEGGGYLPHNTLVLGEVTHMLTLDQVAAGELGPNTAKVGIGRWGFTDQQIEQGRVVVVREGIYWNNVASGIKRNMLRPALIPEGMHVEPGNIVEGAVGLDPAHAQAKSVGIPYTLVRVRAKNMNDGKCRYDEVPTGFAKELMGAISMVGSSGAAMLYCQGIETEGWQRPRSYWHKLPKVDASN